MSKLGLRNELLQFDTKNRGFYDELTDEERKKFSTYLMLKYGANVDGSSDLQEWYLRATNDRVNINFFDIGKHPKLQWLLCSTVSPDMGAQRHYWQPSKKKEGNNKIYKLLAEQYPAMKVKDLELLAASASNEELNFFILASISWAFNELVFIFIKTIG